MRRLRSIILAIAIISLFGMIVSNSFAFKIERMYPSYGGYYDYSGWLYHSACVQTDEPYSDVWWYINDEYVGLSSSHVDNPKTTAYFHAGGYPGSPHGKQYEIKAVAQSFMDENGNIEQDTDSYNVYVYSSPVIDEITSGNWTMATMSGEVDVGWNGTTAEAIASGKITNNTPYDIVYGIRIQYLVGMLQRTNDDLAQQLDVPDHLPIVFGVIEAYADDNDKEYSYSDSYSLWNGGVEGRRYVVEAEVTITAQIAGGDPNQIDQLPVRERQILPIPDND